MSKTISIHSYRGGTGKSNTSANISYVLAAAGKKVCVIDTDIQSPGIHIPLGVQEVQGKTLNDYLWGRAPIEETAIDLSQNLGIQQGKLFLVPCSMNMGDITRILKEGYDVGLLNKGFRKIKEKLQLDYLIIDTHPGLNEETLLSIAISDALLLILRPDQQDFQGTSITIEVARRLKINKLLLVINKILSYHDPDEIKQKVEKTYNTTVAGVLPLSEKMIELGSAGLMVKLHPEERWSKVIKNIAQMIEKV